MKLTISKILLIIGTLSTVGMIYFLAFEETGRLFYILLLISLSTWPVAQYFSWKREKDTESKTPNN
jgi:membrane protein CcdC involved in cytochrome C biogenesis